MYVAPPGTARHELIGKQRADIDRNRQRGERVCYPAVSHGRSIFLAPFFSGSRNADRWTRTERCVCGDWRDISRHISTDEPHGSATGRSLGIVHAVSGAHRVDFFLRVALSIAVRRRVLCRVVYFANRIILRYCSPVRALYVGVR
jgi:hypothetical protein